MHELSQLWLDSAKAALLFVEGPRVRARWDEPSSLPLMTVGALAGHLLHSGILMVEEAFASTEEPSGRPFSAARMLAWSPLDDSSPVHDGVRSVAESQAAEGAEGLFERVAASLQRSEAALAVVAPGTVLAFPWASSLSMTLPEFMRSRILELVVHGDDLAHSVGIEDLPFVHEAIEVACHLGIEINLERYGPDAVLRSLFRRDRNSLDALRTF